jgi:AcrR family transcriptional regulator
MARLRADAEANQERLLQVAALVFARDGADASLKTIAAEAGVGIGTLYRRFPSRDELVEAVYRDQIDGLSATATALLRSRPPTAALQAWAETFIDFVLSKPGMAESLPAILASREGNTSASRVVLRATVAGLLAAGNETDLRPGLDPSEVLMAIGGIALITRRPDQRPLASRLIRLLLEGLLRRLDGPC